MQLLRVSLETAAASPTKTLFARFVFGGAAANGERDFDIPLPTVDADDRVEAWHSPQPGVVAAANGLRTVRNDDYLLVYAQLPDTDDLRSASREVYDRILRHVCERGYPHVVKAWNYVAEINSGSGDDERYKRFCLGRAEAFERSLPAGHPIPAGTAIGTAPGSPFTVVLLAANEPATPVENPRQISAYRYPREYGPKSPTFSRAALVSNGCSAQLFISGTAAIVGHRSRHADDPTGQLTETLSNLHTLFAAAREAGGLSDSPRLDGATRLRIYIRDPALADTARRQIEPLLSDPANAIILHGAICRRELQVEIDGVVTVEAR